MDNLENIIKKQLSNYKDGEKTENYMFFSNLKQIQRQCQMLLELDPMIIEDILQNGHDWADDHITVAKENMDQVFDFLMNTTKESINEAKSNKLCARGIASAKSKFKVYPSAYANGHAVQVCKGKIKGLDGKKKCSGLYCSGKKTVNENKFGFGEFPKPKTPVWIQLMNRANKDGLLADLHYGDKRIQKIAKELATEFEKMEEPNRQSNKDLFLGMFYDRIPRWAWGEPTNSTLMKYGLSRNIN